MVITLYKKYIPEKFRNYIYNLFLKKILYIKRNFPILIKSQFVYLFNFIIPYNNKNRAYFFIGKHGLTYYPFPSSLSYKDKKWQVYQGKESSLFYIIHNDKKLFYPRNYSEDEIIENYRSLLIEQDIHSPHRYVKDYRQLQNYQLLDIGAAEGIFSLDAIEYVEKVFLFEYDPKWIEALIQTFRPWKHKVEIIEKFVSNNENPKGLTIDKFIQKHPCKNLFIKMDIEGSEQDAIQGATKTLNMLNIHVFLAICTYHKKNDPDNISSYLKSIGYNYIFTEGCLCWDNRIIDKVVLRAWRKKINNELPVT